MNSPRKPHVTDHCLLRYCERVLEINLDLIRKQIEKDTAAAVAMGATAVKVGGWQYAIENNAVKTVHPVKYDPAAVKRT